MLYGLKSITILANNMYAGNEKLRDDETKWTYAR